MSPLYPDNLLSTLIFTVNPSPCSDFIDTIVALFVGVGHHPQFIGVGHHPNSRWCRLTTLYFDCLFACVSNSQLRFDAFSLFSSCCGFRQSGGFQGTRVGAEEFSLVHGTKTVHRWKPPIVLLIPAFVIFVFNYSLPRASRTWPNIPRCASLNYSYCRASGAARCQVC